MPMTAAFINARRQHFKHFVINFKLNIQACKMLRFYIIFNILSTVLVASLNIVEPGPLYPPTKGEIWPKPQFQTKDTSYYKFESNKLEIKIVNHKCTILLNAIQRYTAALKDIIRVARPYVTHDSQPVSTANYDGPLKTLNIDLTSPCEEYPHFGMVESYNLTVAADSTLASTTIWGILRGLESWAQLFYLSDNYDELYINKCEIQDYPRYGHRGLLIDTSRHYISVPNILKTLDALAINKMNVLHWHIVDDQSFPYQSEKFPELSRRGAYHKSMVYTKRDIESVINYARDRGIRVLPEFDVPGHTSSWGVAYPNLLTKCYDVYGNYVGLGPMNPINNATYSFLEELFHEIQTWFPETYIHIGGDEVDLQCWESNPELREYLKDHNLTSVAELHALFMRNTIPLLDNKSRPTVWQEVYDEGVPLAKDTIIQVWKDNEIPEMLNILQAGYQLIYSSGWYLDHLKSGGDWREFYNTDPREMATRYGRGVNVEDIVGGESCMWGEVVNDMNIISRVWPRASAVAERLWSSASQTDYMVYRRLEEHTCRMNIRGIHAQPPSGPGFCIAAP